jgi:predicted MFS family arabinose efflux permease
MRVLVDGPARRPVLLLALGTFALGTDAFVISGVLPAVGADLGTSLATTGLLITVFSAVYAVAAPVLAVATGSVCRRRLLLVALAAFTGANVLAAVAPNYGVLVVARVLAATAAGMYTPTASTTAALIAEPAQRGRALAMVTGGITVANAAGVPLGTLVSQVLHWRMTFVLVAVLGVVAFLGLSHALKSVPSPGVPSLRDRVRTIGLPGVSTMLLTTAIAVCGTFTLYTYLSWFAARAAGVSGGLVTLAYLGFGVAAVAATLCAGVLADRFPPRRILFVSVLGQLGGIACVLGLARFGAAALVGSVALWSFLSWLFTPAQQQRLLAAAGREGPVALSLNASAIYLGQAVAGVLGGVALAGGPLVLGVAAGGCELLAVLALCAGRIRVPKAADPLPDQLSAR